MAGLSRTDLVWSNDDVTFNTVPMSALGGDWYTAQIPAQVASTTLSYFIEAEDIYSAVATHPVNAPTVTHRFQFDMFPDIDVTDSVLPADDLSVLYPGTSVGGSSVENLLVRNLGSAVLTLESISTSVSHYYNEDLNDGLAQGWISNSPGDWKVVFNEYRAQDADGYAAMESLYQVEEFTDVSVRVTVRNEDHYAWSGVVLRASPDFDLFPDGTASGSGYFFAVSAAEQMYRVSRIYDGSVSHLVEQAWVPEISFGSNLLESSVIGGQLAFQINGVLLWNGVDNALQEGFAGLGAVTVMYSWKWRSRSVAVGGATKKVCRSPYFGFR